MDDYHAEGGSNYNKLLLKAEKGNFDYSNPDIYTRLMSICSYVASLTDGNALLKFRKIKGLQV